MSQEKKYKILKNETLEHNGRTLYRIQAIKDFAYIEAGEKGGWVEGYHNLSQEGSCWVYNEAKVYDNAVVLDDVEVINKAEIYGNAKVFGKHWVLGNTKIYGDAEFSGDVLLFCNAQVDGFTLNHEGKKIITNVIIEKDIDCIAFRNNQYRDSFSYIIPDKKWKESTLRCTPYFTGEELIKQAYEKSEISGKICEAYVKFIENMESKEKELSKC